MTNGCHPAKADRSCRQEKGTSLAETQKKNRSPNAAEGHNQPVLYFQTQKREYASADDGPSRRQLRPAHRVRRAGIPLAPAAFGVRRTAPDWFSAERHPRRRPSRDFCSPQSPPSERDSRRARSVGLRSTRSITAPASDRRRGRSAIFKPISTPSLPSVQYHYRYYQFYGNTAVVILLRYPRASRAWHVDRPSGNASAPDRFGTHSPVRFRLTRLAPKVLSVAPANCLETKHARTQSLIARQ